MIRKIKITPAFCAMLCLLGWLDVRITLCFVAAVTVHEISNWLAACLFGVKVEQISLGVCGAVIQASGMSYQQEIIISVAGPAASLISAFLLRFESATYFVISIMLALFNSLPIYPMDGGRLLRAFLLMRFSEHKVHRIMRLLAFFTCGLLMLTACWYTAVCQAGIWPIFAALAILLRVGESSGKV